MYCLRCGRDTENEQVFCADCLENMEKYPVKPGTIVQLPRRASSASQKKQVRRRTLSPEEQVVHLKVTVRTLLAILGTLLVAIGICLWLYFSGFLP